MKNERWKQEVADPFKKNKCISIKKKNNKLE